MAFNRFILEAENKFPLQRCITDDIPGAYHVGNAILLKNFLYVCCTVAAASYGKGIFRYDLNNPALRPVRLSVHGQSFGQYDTGYMTSNGTYFYFTAKAGNEKCDHVISKYALKDDALHYVGDIVCGDTPGLFTFLVVREDESIYGLKWNGEINHFSPKGELLQTIIPPFKQTRIHQVVIYDGDVYVSNGSTEPYLRRIEIE